MSKEVILSKKIVQSNKKLYLSSFVAYLVSVMFLIFTGLLIKQIFARYDNKTDQIIWVFIGIYITVLLGRIAMVYINAILISKARFYSENTVREFVLSKILSRPGAEKLNKTTGEILNILRVDINQIADYIQRQYAEIPSNIIFSITAIIILAFVNWKLLIVTFPPLIIITLLIERGGKHITKYHKANREATGAYSSMLGNILGNVLAVKLSNSEKYVESEINRLSEIREKKAIKDNIVSESLRALYNNAVLIGTGLALLAVSLMSRSIEFDLGDFTLFIYYMGFISMTIEFLGGYFISHKKAIIACDNVEKICEGIELNELCENENTNVIDIVDTKGDNLISEEFQNLGCKGLSFVNNGNTVIANVDFSMKKGEKIIITGRVGSGKSVFVKCLLGLLKSQSDEFVFNNQKVDSLTPYIDMGIIVYSSQTPTYFNESITHNIRLNKNFSDSQIQEALEKGAFLGDVNKFNQGTYTMVGTNGVKLSGGQAQRLALARMWARDAQVYVIDDLASAVDDETCTKIWDNIFEDNDKTYIIVSNRKEEIERADRIIVMKNGSINATGTLKELIKNNEEMRLIYST